MDATATATATRWGALLLAGPARGSHGHNLLVGIAPFIVGLVIVAGLIGAVAYGIRIRRSGEQRRGGPPSRQVTDPREFEISHRLPDEVPRDGRRRMPYELKDYDSDSHPGEHEEPRRKWDEGSSGSFGSGGLGHH